MQRLPLASGTGFLNPRAPGNGWVFAAQVGDTATPRLAYVAAGPKWGQALDADGLPVVDEDLLRCLVAADPGDSATYPLLPDAAYHGVFDAWRTARMAIWRSWQRMTDPANLQPEVSRTLRTAADLVRDGHSDLTPTDRNELATTLAQRWPYRISRDVGEILAKAIPEAERIRLLAELVAAEGLEAPPPPVPLPPVEEEEIRLVAWMAVVKGE